MVFVSFSSTLAMDLFVFLFCLFSFSFFIRLWRLQKPQKEMEELYIRGHDLDEDKFDFEMQVVSIKCNVREIIDVLKKNNRDESMITVAQSVSAQCRFLRRSWTVCQETTKSTWRVMLEVTSINQIGP